MDFELNFKRTNTVADAGTVLIIDNSVGVGDEYNDDCDIDQHIRISNEIGDGGGTVEVYETYDYDSRRALNEISTGRHSDGSPYVHVTRFTLPEGGYVCHEDCNPWTKAIEMSAGDYVAVVACWDWLRMMSEVCADGEGHNYGFGSWLVRIVRLESGNEWEPTGQFEAVPCQSTNWNFSQAGYRWFEESRRQALIRQLRIKPEPEYERMLAYGEYNLRDTLITRGYVSPQRDESDLTDEQKLYQNKHRYRDRLRSYRGSVAKRDGLGGLIWTRLYGLRPSRFNLDAPLSGRLLEQLINDIKFMLEGGYGTYGGFYEDEDKEWWRGELEALEALDDLLNYKLVAIQNL